MKSLNVDFKIDFTKFSAACKNAHTALREIGMAMYHHAPVWHISIYKNGTLEYEGTAMNLDRVNWKDKTVDSPTLKVNYNRVDQETVFITLCQLLSYEEYKRYLDQEFPVAKKI